MKYAPLLLVIGAMASCDASENAAEGQGAGAPGGGDTPGSQQSTGGDATAGDGGATSGDATTSPDAAAPLDPCDTLAPDANPSAMRATILACFTKIGRATLTAGAFAVSDGLPIPAGATLRGSGAQATTLTLLPGGGSNFFLSVAGGAPTPTTVSNLRLNANHAIGNLANAATIHTLGTNIRLSDLEVFAPTFPPAGYTAAGVYFIGEDRSDVLAERVDIHHHFYGIIFRSGLTFGTPNRIVASKIHSIKCDSVSFAGYGEVHSTDIYDNGFDCENGPIPGGGIYSVLNDEGGLIKGTTVRNVCGHDLDLDRVAKFVVEDSTFKDPGYRFAGFQPVCGRAAAGQLASVRDSTFKGNVFENNDRPENALPIPQGSFEGSGKTAYSDLPGVAKATVGLWLIVPKSRAVSRSTNNTFVANTFRSSHGATGYTGIGLFTSRDTGYDGAGNWSAQTTNYFTGNVTFGSNVGSVRCGGNWFAGNSTCIAGSPAPCNDDDYQHGAGAFHSDTCPFF